ncbi:whole genome shotgun assembly, reference scaffold set, scaffold scaffold_59 [Methanothermobacter sp. MT-2]|nr:whole genome shotgun assembly, reference scaffold set, scaffold scaffold_59 [Methanothermobacter sp. MT-2]
MRLPIVSVTRSPAKIMPRTSPKAPKILKMLGSPFDRMKRTPIAIPKSSAPTLNAEKDELNT